MPKKFLPSLIAVLLFIASIRGQNNVSFNHLTIENGLSQSAVNCIFQDKQGFMWFGTQDGLNRYDGYNFKVFKNKSSDSASLSDNFIFSIFEDSSGTLFIETQSGKINKYNPVNESFTIVSRDNLNFNKMKMSSFLALRYEGSDIKWYGGQKKDIGLVRENLKTGEKKSFLYSSNKNSLSDDKVYSVIRDKNGFLWIGTTNGLNKLNEETGEFQHFTNDPKNPNSISDNWVWPLFEDSNGNLWVGTVHGGLNKFDQKAGTFTRFRNDPTNPKSISDDYILSIYQDRGGIIWVGTNSGGVNYFNPSQYAFEHYFNIPGNKNSLSDNNVLSMFVGKKGFYWIGTRNGGLNKFDYQAKTFTNFRHNPLNPNSINSNSIQTIYQDKSGLLWIGNFNAGLNSFNSETNNFKSYVNDPKNPNSLTDNRVYAIIEDKNGFIWIGTYAGGLNRLDKSTGKIISYKSNPDDSTSLTSNNVWSLALDNDGNLWVGTFGGGISVLDKSNNMFTHFKNNPKDPRSLCDDNIIRVFKDSKGNMWIGTTKGLCRYFSDTHTFKTYSEDDGLANNFVFGILDDGSGNLWISTNKGLSKFDPGTEKFKNYYIEDGLQDNEFNQNAFAKDYKTGNLLFGGGIGFNVFNPEKVKGNTFVPPIVFTNILKYNTDNEEGKPIVEKGVPEMNKLSLTYKDNIVTLGFAALSYYNSFNNQYKYKLEGFNENWIQLGTNNKVTFTNLSQGDYVLKVIGSNNDGVWNKEGASLNIHVSPPWWKTNIAYGIYLIAFFAFLYGVRKFELDRREKKAQIRESALRIKATEAEKRALEIENERKTKELEEARQLQLSMLPKKLPELTNIEIAAFMRTATEVGGDYYDFRQDNGSLYVAFGDATGHGLQAGTMVTLMKGFFTSDSSKLGMQEFMNHCSKMIKEIELGRILMSFSYLKIENNKLLITSAGMPPIYYYNSKDKQVEEIIIQGMPLGAMKNFPYKVIEREINSGDTLLLLTDGLPEQMNAGEEMFDYTRVKAKFSDFNKFDSQQIIDKLVVEGDNWMNGTMQADDITFVVIKFK
jgi:ligand-binding sensor domain-containing protein/serine phosphatase RsbU (regulator of sigma subunit)